MGWMVTGAPLLLPIGRSPVSSMGMIRVRGSCLLIVVGDFERLSCRTPPPRGGLRPRVGLSGFDKEAGTIGMLSSQSPSLDSLFLDRGEIPLRNFKPDAFILLLLERTRGTGRIEEDEVSLLFLSAFFLPGDFERDRERLRRRGGTRRFSSSSSVSLLLSNSRRVVNRSLVALLLFCCCCWWWCLLVRFWRGKTRRKSDDAGDIVTSQSSSSSVMSSLATRLSRSAAM